MADADEEPGLDDELLRVVAKRLGALRLIDSVAVFPAEKPTSVVATFDVSTFPPEYDRVFLEMRAYTNRDFSITYREEWNGERWQCRWDRHENPHSARDHFHPPAQASSEDAVDRDYPEDFFAVIEIVLGEIDERLGRVWEATAG